MFLRPNTVIVYKRGPCMLFPPEILSITISCNEKVHSQLCVFVDTNAKNGFYTMQTHTQMQTHTHSVNGPRVQHYNGGL